MNTCRLRNWYGCGAFEQTTRTDWKQPAYCLERNREMSESTTGDRLRDENTTRRCISVMVHGVYIHSVNE